MNSRQNKEFFGKIALFQCSDILPILGGFLEKVASRGGKFSFFAHPGPRQNKDFLLEYTPMFALSLYEVYWPIYL